MSLSKGTRVSATTLRVAAELNDPLIDSPMLRRSYEHNLTESRYKRKYSLHCIQIFSPLVGERLG
jgi:hypothetical protein